VFADKRAITKCLRQQLAAGELKPGRRDVIAKRVTLPISINSYLPKFAGKFSCRTPVYGSSDQALASTFIFS
jgi:hypothetical protein